MFINMSITNVITTQTGPRPALGLAAAPAQLLFGFLYVIVLDPFAGEAKYRGRGFRCKPSLGALRVFPRLICAQPHYLFASTLTLPFYSIKKQINATLSLSLSS